MIGKTRRESSNVGAVKKSMRQFHTPTNVEVVGIVGLYFLPLMYLYANALTPLLVAGEIWCKGTTKERCAVI